MQTMSNTYDSLFQRPEERLAAIKASLAVSLPVSALYLGLKFCFYSSPWITNLVCVRQAAKEPTKLV